MLRTELDAVDTSVEAHIIVTYQPDAGHRAVRPGAHGRAVSPRRATRSEVRGVATYSRFRRFQVSTSEELAN